MPTPPTDTDASPTDTDHPVGYLGSAEFRIDVDPDTYERLADEYRRAVERGYSAGFDVELPRDRESRFSVGISRLCYRTQSRHLVLHEA